MRKKPVYVCWYIQYDVTKIYFTPGAYYAKYYDFYVVGGGGFFPLHNCKATPAKNPVYVSPVCWYIQLDDVTKVYFPPISPFPFAETSWGLVWETYSLEFRYLYKLGLLWCHRNDDAWFSDPD